MFTFPAGLALKRVGNTLEPAEGVPGVVTSTIDGSVLASYDLDELEQPVVTGDGGYYGQFKSTEPLVRVSFGDVALVLVSLESINAGAAAADAKVAAENAALAAQDAATQAATSATAATAVTDQMDAAVQAAVQTAVDETPVLAERVQGLPDMIADVVGSTPVPAGQVHGLDTLVSTAVATATEPFAGEVDTLSGTVTALDTEVGGLTDQVADLATDVATSLAQKGFVVVENRGDPIPPGNAGNLAVYKNATGGTDPDPEPTTLLRRRFLTDVADNTPLTLAGGTGDTPLTAISSSSLMVQVIDGKPRAHIVGSSALTYRDNSAGLTPAGDLPLLDAFTFALVLRVLTYPPSGSTPTFMQLTGACALTLNSSGGVTVMNGDGTAAATSAGGSIIGDASPALALDADYTIKGWRAAGSTIAQFAIYDDAGTRVWGPSGPVNRDVGTGAGLAWIRGKTGPVGGEWAITDEELDDTGVELP